jgi:CTP synthase (UTP-ammonia lyase)
VSAAPTELGEVRIVELPGRRFFVATLFVPQASSVAVRPHRLVTPFVAAAARVSYPTGTRAHACG